MKESEKKSAVSPISETKSKKPDVPPAQSAAQSAAWVSAVAAALSAVAAIVNPIVHPQEPQHVDEETQEERLDTPLHKSVATQQNELIDLWMDPRVSNAERHSFLKAMAESKQVRDIFISDLVFGKGRKFVQPQHRALADILARSHSISPGFSSTEDAVLTLIDARQQEGDRVYAALYLGALAMPRYEFVLKSTAKEHDNVGLACKVALQMIDENADSPWRSLSSVPTLSPKSER